MKEPEEDMVGDAARVGVMLLDGETGLMVEQAVQHMRCFAGGSGDDLGVEGAILGSRHRKGGKPR